MFIVQATNNYLLSLHKPKIRDIPNFMLTKAAFILAIFCETTCDSDNTVPQSSVCSTCLEHGTLGALILDWNC